MDSDRYRPGSWEWATSGGNPGESHDHTDRPGDD